MAGQYFTFYHPVMLILHLVKVNYSVFSILFEIKYETSVLQLSKLVRNTLLLSSVNILYQLIRAALLARITDFVTNKNSLLVSLVPTKYICYLPTKSHHLEGGLPTLGLPFCDLQSTF